MDGPRSNNTAAGTQLPPPPPGPPPNLKQKQTTMTAQTNDKSTNNPASTITPTPSAPVLPTATVIVEPTPTPVDMRQTPPQGPAATIVQPTAIFHQQPTATMTKTESPSTTTMNKVHNNTQPSTTQHPVQQQINQSPTYPDPVPYSTIYNQPSTNPPAFTPPTYHQQYTPTINTQMASFQQSMFDQNQRQMELMQQQFQLTLEQSLKTISDTVAKTLASAIPPTQLQHQSHRQQPTPPLPPEIRLSPTNSEKCDISDYKSATSVIPPPSKQPEPNPTSAANSVSTSSSKQEMLDFVAALREPKLVFHPLKQSTDFIAWRTMMALKCSKNTKYANLARINDEGQYEFNPDITIEESSTLFMLIYDALGPMSDKIIVDVTNPNGHSLLDQLEEYYVDIDTSVVNRQILLQEFEALKRHDNESYHQFGVRYLKKQKQLQLNQVIIPTDDASTAYRFLRGLNETRINTEICLELMSKPDWYYKKTILEIARKAEKYMWQYQNLLDQPPKSNRQNSNNTNNTSKRETEKKKQEQKSDSSKDSTPTPPEPGSHEEKVQTMESYLAKANNVEAYLRGIKRNDKEKFSEKATKNACTNLNIFDVWTKINNENTQPKPTGAAAAKRVTSNTDSVDANTTALFTNLIQKALSEHSETMMSKFKELQHNDAEQGQNSNDNSNNENVNEYLNVNPNVVTPPSHPPISIPSPNPPDPLAINPQFHAPSMPSTTGPVLVTDSGCTHTMAGLKELFENITYYDPNHRPEVTLGDNASTCHIHGYGYMSFQIDKYFVRLLALYIPDLGSTSLLSIKQHMQWTGTFFHAEGNEATLAFPTFSINMFVRDEIEYPIQPLSQQPPSYDFDESEAVLTTYTNTVRSCKLIKQNIIDYIPQPEHHQTFIQTVQMKQLAPEAIIPSKATPGSVGYDVHAIHGQTIMPNQIAKLHTGLAVAMPSEMYLRIAPRSSLALKHLTIEGGVVDSDYRGEIVILMKNNSNKPYTILPTDRIAQFIFEIAASPCIEVTESLPSTIRNENGFGSTNKTSSQSGPTSRHTTFRINEKYILAINNSNPFRPVARRIYAPTLKRSTTSITSTSAPQELPNLNPIETHEIPEDSQSPTPSVLDQAVIKPSPLPPKDTIPNPTCSDTPNTSIPSKIVMSHDSLHKAVGYHNTANLIKHIHEIGAKTVQIQNLPKVESIDPGETASLPSQRKQKIPSTPPPQYSDIWHMDIGHGPNTAIGGIRYTLLLVDKATRFKFVFGLKNLTTSLLTAIKRFMLLCGTPPKIIRTDFDNKLISGEVEKFLLEEKVRIEASPPYRQHQNGLVERHWQAILAMSRNWLRSSLLPTKYWYFAVKRAVEVSNIMPTKHKKIVTTPFELVYNKKPDYRMLFPMFSIAYIRQHREDGKDINSWKSKSLKCIAVGSCPKSDGLIFYHPPSKQLLTCGDGYRFDPYSPSGPQFGQLYEQDFDFITKSATHNIHSTPTHELNTTAYIKNDDSSYSKVTILDIPTDEDELPYTIQHEETGDIIQVMHEELCDHDPTANPQTLQNNQKCPFPHIPWVKHDAKITLFLPTIMKKPKQGFLSQDNDQWTFVAGRTRKGGTIELPNFPLLVDSLITNKKLFKGWINSTQATAARHVRMTSNVIAHQIIARKVSARNLHKLEAPTLLNHCKLHPEDKETWDQSYAQEYNGLVDIDTWELISETDYQQCKHIFGNLMPTMALAVIKYDENGKPVRAKYRIVALGNLDPHTWTKNDCFAPVLSQMELRLLTAIAVRCKRLLKSGDIVQAFCQSYLPPGENYICRPPAGCPLTPPNTYLKLKKTLYGLKRSPRHFYDLAVKTLTSIGLQQHPNSPCLFYGTLLPNEPPLYLGLYVDDFVYFSESDNVEKEFEKRFSSKLDMDLNGPVSYFLGLKFTPTYHDDGNLSVKLSQEAFIDTLRQQANLDGDDVSEPLTPYRNGHPIDTIPLEPDLPLAEQQQQNATLQTLVGSLNWLSTSTRPDIAPVTNFLAKYNNKASKGHIKAAKYVIRYLKGTKSLGITFSSSDRTELNSHVKFPIPPTKITALTDANWGPQDQSHPNPTKPQELELFKSRSMSGFLLWLGGPLHWVAKRQTITARSSAEAEIYATDECVKQLIQLSYILDGLNMLQEVMPNPTPIFNDNTACVTWSKSTTTKGLRHIQMRENAIREAVATDFVSINHIEGKINLADLFTKEDKDVNHFQKIRDIILGEQPFCTNNSVESPDPVSEPPLSNPSPVAPSPGGCQVGGPGGQVPGTS